MITVSLVGVQGIQVTIPLTIVTGPLKKEKIVMVMALM